MNIIKIKIENNEHALEKKLISMGYERWGNSLKKT